MSKDSGYLVETKTGLKGRTYHRENLIEGKVVVHIEKDGKEVKLLSEENTLKIIGYVD